MRKVKKGRTLRVSVLRERLAARFGADATCPLVAGILINIVAGATEEQWEEGRRRAFAPYWRIVRDDGVLSEKLPLGAARQAELLQDEGHTIRQSRGKWRFES